MLRAQLRLAAALGAVLVAAWLWLAWRDGSERVEVPGAVRLWALSAGDVERVEVVGPDGVWAVARDGEDARIEVAGATWPGDDRATLALWMGLSEAGLALPLGAVSDAELGLDLPARVRFRADGRWRALEIGALSPIDGHSYARVDGEVFALRGDLARLVRQPWQALQDTRLLPPRGIGGVRVEVGGRPVAAVRREGDRWRWSVEPTPSIPASEWLRALEDVRVDAWSAGAGGVVARVVVEGDAPRAVDVLGGPGAWWVRFEDGREGEVGEQLDDLW